MRRTSGSRKPAWRQASFFAAAVAGALLFVDHAAAQFGGGPIQARRGGGVSINLPFVRVRTGPGGTAVDAPFTRVRTGVYGAPYGLRGPFDFYRPYAPYPVAPDSPYPYGYTFESPLPPPAPAPIPIVPAVTPQVRVPVRVYVDASAEVIIPERRNPGATIVEPLTPEGAIAGSRSRFDTASAAPVVPPSPQASAGVQLGSPTINPLPAPGLPALPEPAPAQSVPANPEPAGNLTGPLVVPSLPAPADTGSTNGAGDEPEETVIKQRAKPEPSADNPAIEPTVPAESATPQQSTGAAAPQLAAPPTADGLPARHSANSAPAEIGSAAPSPQVHAVTGQAATRQTDQPSYLVIPTTGAGNPPRIGPIARGQAAPEGTVEYVLAPMPHTEVPARFEPRAGTHLFAFVHPQTGGTVAVEVPLPEGRPRIDVAANSVTFQYGRQSATIHFLLTGSAYVSRTP